MSDLQLRAIIAGVLFGTWPLLMNRSGVSGNLASGAFAIGAFLVVLPFALREWGHTAPDAVWSLVITSSIVGGLGLLVFGGMLAKAPGQSVGSLIVLMTVVQVCIPAVHHIITTGGLTLSKGLGFAAAVVAALLLV